MSRARVAVVVPAYNEERLIARTLRGTDVDQPRNLAKSVTVE